MRARYVLIVLLAAGWTGAIAHRAGQAAPLASGQEGVARGGERFDALVRADFFAGLAGDRERFERAMRVCAETLERDPDHPEALAWHGSGLLHRAWSAFQRGDFSQGGELWERGMSQMDRAVRIAPDDVGALIPRGATLLEVSRSPGVPGQRQLLERGVADYERVLTLQEPYFDTLPVHARGELLFGLAEGLHRLGETERARGYFERAIRSAPGSEYERRARQWLSAPPDHRDGPAGCIGCHAPADGRR
jgi:tetratricopeptide (TPR) repeat protein